jgi:hypothetical protein
MKQQIGLIRNVDNSLYHSGDSVSSSQLKDMLKDPETYYRTYITKEIGKKHMDAFDVGSYYHTAILEPHKLDSEFVVYEGRRAGAEWDSFKEKSKNLTIIAKGGKIEADTLIEATRKSPIAMSLIDGGEPELSCYTPIAVENGRIFASTGDKIYEMTVDGPVETEEKLNDGTGIMVKVRCDWVDFERGFIMDLKSTSGNTKDVREAQKKISDLDYDMSAALYVDMFNLWCGGVIKDFLWVFASKTPEIANSKTYASSSTMLKVGRAKWMEGIRRLAKCIDQGWNFPDEVAVLEPSRWDLDWLKPKNESVVHMVEETEGLQDKPSEESLTTVSIVRDEDLI